MQSSTVPDQFPGQAVRVAKPACAEPLESRVLFAVGDVDPTFGEIGATVVSFRSAVQLTNVRDTLVLPDGRTLIAGRANQTGGADGDSDVAIGRLNADGTADISFGDGGVAVFPSITPDDSAEALALQTDGKIVLTGFFGQAGGVSTTVATQQLITARLNDNGTPDTTFGPGGIRVGGNASLNIAAGAAVRALANGVVLVGGTTEAEGLPETLLVRYLNDGSFDTTFGTGGIATPRLTGGAEFLVDLVIQPDGKIVTGGTTSVVSAKKPTFLVQRFNPDGTADTSFGDNGAAVADFSAQVSDAFDASTNSLLVTPDGRIVLAGFVVSGNQETANGTDLFYSFGLARFTRTGRLDRSFGKRGLVLGSPGNISSGQRDYEVACRVTLEPGGGLIVSGCRADSSRAALAGQISPIVAGYDADGTPDDRFAGDGQTILGPDFSQAAAPAANRLLPAAQSQADQFQEILRKDAAIAGALGDRLLLIKSAGGAVTVTRLIGNGADLLVATPAGLKSRDVIGGTRGFAAVPVSNDGDQNFAGNVTVTLLLSTDGNIDAGDAMLTESPQSLKLKPGQARTLNLRFGFPSDLSDGSYVLLAQVDPGANQDAFDGNNAAGDTVPLALEQPFVDLVGSFATATGATGTLASGRNAMLSIRIRNEGNVIATGPVTVQVQASTDVDRDTGDVQLTAGKPLTVNLKPSTDKSLKLIISVPSNLPAGSYLLLAALDGSALPVPLRDPQNDIFASTTPIVIG